MPQSDFIASRFGAVICAAILDEYRSGLARDVTVSAPLPAIIGHSRPGATAPVCRDEIRVS